METRRINRVSAQQLDMLWEFLSNNRDIATAFNRSLQAKEYSKRKWTELAEMLNSQGDGTHKDWRGWSKYWVDYKAKLKARVAAVRSSHGRTGGGPSTEKPLTEVEVKFLQILGEDFGEGLPGIRVEPFPEFQEIMLPDASVPVLMDVQDSPASESILQNLQLIPITIQSISTEPAQDTRPQTPCPTRSANRTPTQCIQTPVPPTTRSPRRRRLRRELTMTSDVARGVLVRSCQVRAEAAVRNAEAMEKIAEKMEQLQKTSVNIERILHAAFPTAAGQVNSE